MKRKCIIVMGIALIVLAILIPVFGMAHMLSLPKIYKASSIVQIASSADIEIQSAVAGYLMSDQVLREVINECDLQTKLFQTSSETEFFSIPIVIEILRDRIISVTSPEGLSNIQVQASTEDPSLSAKIVNQAVISLERQLPSLSKNSDISVRVISVALPPSRPASPDLGSGFRKTGTVAVIVMVMGVTVMVIGLRKTRAIGSHRNK